MRASLQRLALLVKNSGHHPKPRPGFCSCESSTSMNASNSCICVLPPFQTSSPIWESRSLTSDVSAPHDIATHRLKAQGLSHKCAHDFPMLAGTCCVHCGDRSAKVFHFVFMNQLWDARPQKPLVCSMSKESAECGEQCDVVLVFAQSFGDVTVWTF